jgi:hypothetical protein
VPDNDLNEQVAEILATHTIECTGPGEVTCRGCREAGWMSWYAYRQHVAPLMVAHVRAAIAADIADRINDGTVRTFASDEDRNLAARIARGVA